MVGLPSSLYKHCQNVLMRCSEFNSDNSLRPIFVTSQLHSFRNGLPTATSKGERVQAVIAYLLGEKTAEGQSALSIFLETLRNRYLPGDALYRELDALAREVNQLLSPDEDRISHTLEMARRALQMLEMQAAGYTSLHIPAHLQIELEEKRREVIELENRLRAVPTRHEIANRYALLIGISNYVDPSIAPSLHVTHDVVALADVLSGSGYIVRLLHSDQRDAMLRPTRENIWNELELLAQVTGPDDLLIVYFSGQGIMQDYHTYLLSEDSRVIAGRRTAIDLKECKQILAAASAQTRVLFLDMPSDIETSMELDVAVVHACSFDQVSYKHNVTPHSAFAYYLLEGLRGAAASPGSRSVSLLALIQYVLNAVQQWAFSQGLRQQPTFRTAAISADPLLITDAPSAPVYAAVKTLIQCNTVEQMVLSLKSINWIPDNFNSLDADTAQVWPRLVAIGQDISTALVSDSVYTRRLGLSHVQDDLTILRQQVTAMDGVSNRLWKPVVDTWVQVLNRELTNPLQEHGQNLINPYDAGNPLTVRRADLFRGRAGLTARVAGALLEHNRPTLVLHGPRRMGKTSFLLQLPRLLPGRTVPVFVDLQRGDATANTPRFFYTIARAITSDARSHSRLTLPAPDLLRFEREPFGAFADWQDDVGLPALEQAGNFNLLLCFDEFEKLGQALEAQRVDERVLDELRHTIQHRQAISVLFAGVQTLEDLGPRWSSYFISVRPLRIGYLSVEEATGLIRNPDPASSFNLEYTDSAVADILAATRCHPYLVQLVCSTLIDLVNQHRTLLATPELVQESLTLSLDRGEPYFRNLWDETPGADPATLAAGRHILRKLAATSEKVQVEDTPEIVRALDRLLRYDVLERIEGDLRYQVPLVERWMRERAPVI